MNPGDDPNRRPTKRGDNSKKPTQTGGKRKFGDVTHAEEEMNPEGSSRGPKAAKTSDNDNTQDNTQSPTQRRSQRLAGMQPSAASQDNPQSPTQTRNKRKAGDMTSPEDMKDRKSVV